MENITASEVAGYCVGGLLVVAALSAPKVDVFIAQGQRRTLGLCVECGGLRQVCCAQCRGTGTQRAGMETLLAMLLSPTEKSADTDKERPPCSICRGKGHFPCSACLRAPNVKDSL